MCWHLSIAVPDCAVEQLHRVLPAVAPAHPELDPEVVAATAQGGRCYSLGIQCACELFRKGATTSERLRRRSQRDHWSEAKLQRALKGLGDEWSGLHPEVCEALAAVVRSAGEVSVFLFWAGRGGRSDVREMREIDLETFRCDPSLVTENRLIVVKRSVQASH